MVLSQHFYIKGRVQGPRVGGQWEVGRGGKEVAAGGRFFMVPPTPLSILLMRGYEFEKQKRAETMYKLANCIL